VAIRTQTEVVLAADSAGSFGSETNLETIAQRLDNE
jgi:hypothetical protein